MPEGQLLEFAAVTKRFGAVTAVDSFSARVEPGRVTGFLGPNGAGKTTTLRILLGLVRATQGTATIGGVPYAQLRHPLQNVGAVLEASSFHPGRTAANHLKVYAQAAGLPTSRVDDALGLVGLGDVGGRKVGGYSLGMRQRLGLAYALLGDPGVLVLDEPANGLDPEGIKWMRGLLRDLARQGRTVLVSSHLLAEVQQTVDSLLILSAGKLVFEGALTDLADPSEYATVADAGDRGALSAALHAAGVDFDVLRSGLTVRGLEPAQVGQIAADAGVALSALQRRGPALEEIFLDLVNGTRVHPTTAEPAGQAPDAGALTDGTVPAAAAGAVAAVAVADAADAADAADERDASAPGAEAIHGSDADAVIDDVVGDDEIVPGVAEHAPGDAGSPGDGAWGEDSGDELEAAHSGANETPSPGAAAFAVASTGIIDIIPPAEAAAAADTAEAAGTTAGTAEAEADRPADEAGSEDVDDADGDDGGVDDPADADAPGGAASNGDADSHADEGSDSESGPVAPVRPAEREWKPPAGWAEPVEWRAPAEWTGAMPVAAAVARETEGGSLPERDAEQAPDEAEEGTSEDLQGEPATSIPEDSDRPWETYVKLESDVEADRFFGSFDEGLDAGEPATPTGGQPLVSAMETPAATDLGGSSPHWHEQPEPLSATAESRATGDDSDTDTSDGGDARDADEPSAQHPDSDPPGDADADSDDNPDTSWDADAGSSGPIGDLSPEWADAERGDDDTSEGGEQR